MSTDLVDLGRLFASDQEVSRFDEIVHPTT